MQDIAERAGVNVSTVSRVLAGKAKAARIGDETARRVISVAEELGYRPNLSARALRTSKTDTLGLLVTDLANPFFATISAACEAEASAAGYGVMVATSGENRDREAHYISLLRSRPVDGLIITPAGLTPHPELKGLMDEGFPLVLMDRRIDGMACDSVVVDNRDGARRLVEELIGIGRETIAFACGPGDTWTGAERMKGFVAGIEDAGLSLREGLVHIGSYDEETGRQAARMFLESTKRPDAVVAANNRILEGVLEVLIERGPGFEDIAVGAFDGVPFAGLMNRPIVVARQPRREIGRRAARLLIERIEGTGSSVIREEVLPVHIIWTGSGRNRS